MKWKIFIFYLKSCSASQNEHTGKPNYILTFWKTGMNYVYFAKYGRTNMADKNSICDWREYESLFTHNWDTELITLS